MKDSATIELIERIDAYIDGLGEDTPDGEDLSALEERLAALQLRLAKIADDRDPAGNATMLECHREDCPECRDLLELAGLIEGTDDDRMPAESQIYPLDR